MRWLSLSRSGGQIRPVNCLKTCYKVPFVIKQIANKTPRTDKRRPFKGVINTASVVAAICSALLARLPSLQHRSSCHSVLLCFVLQGLLFFKTGHMLTSGPGWPNLARLSAPPGWPSWVHDRATQLLGWLSRHVGPLEDRARVRQAVFI